MSKEELLEKIKKLMNEEPNNFYNDYSHMMGRKHGRQDALRECLGIMNKWYEYYAIDIFPNSVKLTPDSSRDSVSAHVTRHVLNCLIEDVQKLMQQEDVNQGAPIKDGMKYCIVRTYSAGVFAGFVESRAGQEVVMRQARRIFYWDGAASLSQLAIDGTSKPQNCKFPESVDRVELLQAIEILYCTEKSKKSIESVSIWKM